MSINSCRICSNFKDGELVDLFSSSVSDYHAGKVKFCSGIELSRDDLLPQKICLECLQQVKAACRIKLKCIEADQQHRAVLKTEKQQTIKLESQNEPKVEAFDDYMIERADSDDEIYQECEESLEEHDVRSTEESNPKELLKPSNDRRCPFCHVDFEKIFEKKRHLEAAHSNELTCHICKKQKSSVIGTERCMRSHLGGSTFLCQFCALTFHYRSAMLSHIAHVHVSGKFTCDFCGKSIKHRISLIRHMRTIHTNNRFACPHGCPEKAYSTMNSLRIHLYRRHDVPAPVHCPVCGAGFSNAAEIKAHNKSRGGCGSNRNLLLKPKRTVSMASYSHIVDGSFHCKFCSKVYSSKKNIYDHYHNFHMDNKTCEICKKSFGSNSSYRFHFASVHEAEKRTRCEFPRCRKSYKSDAKLAEHKKTHEGQEIRPLRGWKLKKRGKRKSK